MKTRLKNKIIGGAITTLSALSVVLILAIIIIILVVTIIGGKSTLSWEFLTSFPTEGMMKGGIFPAIYGTALLVIVMSIAAVPFGTITAIYLSEYAHEKSWLAQTIRFAVRTLATVPSIKSIPGARRKKIKAISHCC